MSPTRVATRPAALLALALCAVIAACDNPFQIPPATLPNSAGALTLFALTRTAIETPSAFDILGQTVARTDRTPSFDFAFDIPDSLHDTVAVLIPRGALGLTRDGGLQIITKTPYDSIKVAPTSGYDSALKQKLAVGTVVVAASRGMQCNFGFIRPLYMKLQVTALDFTARSVTFNTLLDPNCGYISLQASTLPPTQ
jgi:hypothetical protein